jgi:hypothetical protein
MPVPVAQLCTLLVHSLKSAQITPEPVNPALHVHVKEPSEFWHAAVKAQLCWLTAHSSMSLQEEERPEPVNPGLHAQEKDPAVFVQPPRGGVAHVCAPLTHSLLSVQITPVPAYPVLQAHVKDPPTSVQDEDPDGQLCEPMLHSFRFVHTVPEPP